MRVRESVRATAVADWRLVEHEAASSAATSRKVCFIVEKFSAKVMPQGRDRCNLTTLVQKTGGLGHD